MSAATNTIFVTGGCGFIGSNLVLRLLDRHPDWRIVNIDALTYAADRENLAGVEDDPRYIFRHLSIVDREGLRELFREFEPSGVFHLAAESHVDNSISSPGEFIRTNVIGTFNLLEEARALWGADPAKRFLHVSTDEVYGTLGSEGYFTEESQYAPNSPYSASKAGSDHLVRAWHHTYGLNTVTTNCANNFGPRQHREKLIPTVISSVLDGRPIPVYGDGSNVREWLYVEDHCAALDTVYHKGRAGETYGVGARNERRNIDLVGMICDIIDEEGEGRAGARSRDLITFVADRPGHDQRYAVDPSKIENELGWRAEISFQEALRSTVQWYCRKFRPQAAV